MPPAERALHLASSKRGVREAGRNRGTWVERFLRAVGLQGGFPWCAAFVYWCMAEAGCDISRMVPRKWGASVRRWADWAIENGRRHTQPRRGMLFYWLNDGLWRGHIGWIAEVSGDGKRIRCIEGNTNKRGSRDGDGVYGQWREVSYLRAKPAFGFIDVSDL